MAPAAMLSESRIRQVPSTAPRILFSSKEFIEFRLPKRGVTVRSGYRQGPGVGDQIPVCLASGNPYKRLRHFPTFVTCAEAPGAPMPDTIIFIPARLASTRLPGKPLADLHGAPMIVHVMRRAEAARIGDVIVATDSEAVAAAVEKAGGRAVMTRSDHQSEIGRAHV